MSLFTFGVLFGTLIMLIITSSLDNSSKILMIIILCFGTYGSTVAIEFS